MRSLKASTVLSKVTPTPSATSSISTKCRKLRFPTQVFFKTITTEEQEFHCQTVTTIITNTQQTFRLECLSTPPVGENHFSVLKYDIIFFIGMNIVFWNSQGLRPKRKELQKYFLENQIDIQNINETYLKLTHKLQLSGYDIYKNDRLVGTKGGVAILVKTGIIVN